MRPYDQTSYKSVLKTAVLESTLKSRTFQAMAEHCRIQKTYLSKVLNRDGHLSEDQLFLALDYLGFDDEARDFTMLLHAWERSTLPSRRDELSRRLDQIRALKLKTESNLKVKVTETTPLDLAEYFLNPILQIIHMCLTIKKYAHDPEKISAVLRIDREALGRHLKSLQKMGIIRVQKKSAHVEVVMNNLHLPSDSVLQGSYSAKMRLKALEQIENVDSSNAYRFSALFSASEQVKQEIHASFMNWLKETQKRVQTSREDHVFQINFDLVKWT